MRNLIQKNLYKNTIFLYMLAFSNQILGLFLIPYLTRILGPVIYGQLGVALSLMSYVQIILDFGFTLSATEEISKNQEDYIKCGRILSTVIAIKVIMVIVLFSIFVGTCLLVPTWKRNIKLYLFFYVAYAINSILPDFFYRGMEEMKIITIRTVCIKIFFTVLIFYAVNNENDLLWYPILLCIANFIAVVWSYIHIRNEYGVTICKLEREEAWRIWKRTVPFFISRISATAYQGMTTILLGIICVNQPVVGYYAAADKLLTLTKTASSPIADSLYPYMTKNKDYRLIKKVIKYTAPIVLVCAIMVFVLAEPICVLLFGVEYMGAAGILRCIVPAIAVILPTYIISFPLLVPMGLEKQANFSNVVGGLMQVSLIILLFATGNINAYSVCICGTVSEVTVFFYRAGVAIKYRDRMSLKSR